MVELKADLKAVSWVGMWAFWTAGKRVGPRAAQSGDQMAAY